jgi:hypothetical protein
VLDVLGLSVDHLWGLLGERIGPERAEQIRSVIDRLAGAWAFIADVQARGIAAVWEHIQSQISGLWDTILSQAQAWIMSEIVDAVVGKLLSMLDPTGVMAVVNSFVAFFNAAKSVMEYFNEIVAIVDRYVATVAAIAAGNVQPGADQLEAGLAAAVPVAIGFLAGQAGMGDVSEKVSEIIAGVREVIDEALRWLIDQAVTLGESALAALGFGGEEEGAAPGEAVADHETFKLEDEDHEAYEDPSGLLTVASGTPKQAKDVAKLVQFHTEYRALPATASKGQKDAIIDRMIALIKADPELVALLAEEKMGDPPNLGEVGRHSGQSKRFQPKKKFEQYAPLWELESEHVIPKQFLGSFFDRVRESLVARGLPGPAAITDGEYDALTTVLIFKVAADLKTDGDEADLAVIRQLGDRYAALVARWHADRQPGDSILDYDLDAGRVLREMADLFHGVLGRTERVVAQEWDLRATERGHTPDEAQEKLNWMKARVREAHARQLPQMVALLDDRIS